MTIHCVCVRGLLAACLALVLNSSLQAQAIKVVKKPAPAAGPDEYVVYDHWVSSWGLRDDPPDVYSMGISGHPTEAAAVATAKAHMARTAQNGSLSVTHYLIEGEPSVRSNKGPSLPSDKRVEDDAIENLKDDDKKTLLKVLGKDIQNAFKRKNQEVRDAFRRATAAKEFIVRNVDKIAEDDFKKANSLVAEYNGLKDKYAGEQANPQYFAALPRMTPVSADDVARQQAKWKASQESQDDLLKEKAELDQERARLEAERNRLIQDAGNLDDERERIAQLERSATTAEGPIAGPFTLYTGQFSNTRGSKDREYDGFADARAAGEKHMSERSSSQPNYRIADKSGTDIEYDGLFGRKKVSTARIQQSNAKPDPANDPATVVARRKGGLANSQRDRRDRADAYKSDLAKYQQRLEAYQQKLATHKKEINTWGDDQYRGPKPAASKSR